MKIRRIVDLVVLTVFLMTVDACDKMSEQDSKESVTQTSSRGFRFEGWMDKNSTFPINIILDNDEPIVDLPQGFPPQFRELLGTKVVPEYAYLPDMYGGYTVEIIGYTTEYYYAYFARSVSWDKTDYQKTDIKGRIYNKRDFTNIYSEIYFVDSDEGAPEDKAPNLSFVGRMKMPDQIGEWVPLVAPGTSDSEGYFYQYSVLAASLDNGSTKALYIYANSLGELIACPSMYASPTSYSNGYLVQSAIGEEYDFWTFIGTTKYVW